MTTKTAPQIPARRRMSVLALLCLALASLGSIGLVGCGGDTGVEAEAVGDAADLSPADLGVLGARIHQSPQEADAILESEGLTWEEFEAAVRDVSADVDDARTYAEAFQGEGGPAATDDAS